MYEYQVLNSNNRSVNQKFHGNRNFYNYNKGDYNIKSLSKNNENYGSKVNQEIEKVITKKFCWG